MERRSQPFASLEKKLREGRGAEVRALLATELERRLARQDVAPIASLLWRAGLAEWGVRLLNPIVRGERHGPPSATDEERAVYARCLIRLGALEEARELLEQCDPRTTPCVLLYLASAAIARWDYAAAIPLLVRYIRSPGLCAYDRAVGAVNLAAASVVLRERSRTKPLIDTLLYETGSRGWHLLYGNVLEILAQSFVDRGRWEEAEKCLQRAEDELRAMGSLDLFFVQKWRAILALKRGAGGAKARSELWKIRQAASHIGHWESVRDCDRVAAIGLQDEDLLRKVFFGTSSPSFRALLLQEFPKRPAIPESYLWDLKGNSGPVVLDLCNPISANQPALLPPGRNLHRLLSALCSDFYRPLSVAALHSLVYPDDYFNPVTSPRKVRELIRRLRQRLEAQGIPLEIELQRGGYRLTTHAACAIRLKPEALVRDSYDFPLRRLREQYSSGEPFSVRDAIQAVGLPRRSVQRLLREGVHRGELGRQGRAAFTRYRFGTSS